jgi:hypothetical protein
MENFKYLLLIGGNGVLGTSIVNVFKNINSNWKICVIDYQENPEADKNIIISKEDKFNDTYIKNLYERIEPFSKVFHAIINVAGGWERGSVKNIEIFSQTEEMLNKNYYSSLLGNLNLFYLDSCSFGN